MRNSKLVAILLLLAAPGLAQTKIFMRASVSPLGYTAYYGTDVAGNCGVGGSDTVWMVANTTQGASTTQQAAFQPDNGGVPCLHQTANDAGSYLYWITPPISSGVTISGNINYSIGCAESATAMNLGYRFVVYRWSVANGGIVSTIHTSAATTECGTSLALRTVAAAAPTSTAMSVGDRIAFVVQLQGAGGGFGGNGTRTATVGWDGAAASVRDTFANFANTISFSADTNNARPIVGSLWDALRLWRDKWFV